jgi:hypothetical protein
MTPKIKPINKGHTTKEDRIEASDIFRNQQVAYIPLLEPWSFTQKTRHYSIETKCQHKAISNQIWSLNIFIDRKKTLN